MMKFCIIGFIWDHMCIKEFLGAFEQGSSSSVHLSRDLVFWPFLRAGREVRASSSDHVNRVSEEGWQEVSTCQM